MTTQLQQILKIQKEQQARFFESVMARINAIQKEEDLDDQLSCDISNLPPEQQAEADAALAKKAAELGLA